MLEKYLNQVTNQEIKDWINTTLKKRLTKNPENQGEIEHILDYLNSDKAPKRLRKMSYVQAKESAEKWVKTLVKKGKNIDDLDQLEIIKKYKNGFRFVRLVGKESYEREGNLMSHCVASYYGKESEVYSLRDEKNTPHCTIEVQRNSQQIQQIKGKGNGSIHPKYIKMVLSILKHFNMNINPNDMSNLGYIHLESYEIDFIKQKFGKYKLHTIKENTYLFKGC